MIVVNFFGGPCIGKSVIATDYFSYLKKQHKNAELVTEYAKDMVYEGRDNILQDQLYVLAKQNRKLSRLLPKGIDYAVVDSPLILSSIYYQLNGGNSPLFIALVREIFDSYTNVNFLLERDMDLPYSGVGRIQQNIEHALKIDVLIRSFLLDNVVPFIPIKVTACDFKELDVYVDYAKDEVV